VRSRRATESGHASENERTWKLTDESAPSDWKKIAGKKIGAEFGTRI
jgi:hypothetical protein